MTIDESPEWRAFLERLTPEARDGMSRLSDNAKKRVVNMTDGELIASAVMTTLLELAATRVGMMRSVEDARALRDSAIGQCAELAFCSGIMHSMAVMAEAMSGSSTLDGAVASWLASVTSRTRNMNKTRAEMLNKATALEAME